ncbi:hypothetical protein HY570_03275 [Candidatus Micrarchaeota archaeon]|nr:hypothetical protein [Candidatus Micrarchaeota archaeon]
MEVRESCKVEKNLLCSCGATYKFEFNTDLEISSLTINAQCSKCNAQIVLSLDSLLRNRAITSQESSIANIGSSLSFMDQPTSTEDTSKELMDIFKD